MEWRLRSSLPMKVMTHDFHRSYQRDADADAGRQALVGYTCNTLLSEFPSCITVLM